MDIDIGVVVDFVTQVGVPGALLFGVLYIGIRLLPHFMKFFMEVPVSLEHIATVITDVNDEVKSVRQEVRDLNHKLSPPAKFN